MRAHNKTVTLASLTWILTQYPERVMIHSVSFSQHQYLPFPKVKGNKENFTFPTKILVKIEEKKKHWQS